jgi:hypothetical protein
MIMLNPTAGRVSWLGADITRSPAIWAKDRPLATPAMVIIAKTCHHVVLATSRSAAL